MMRTLVLAILGLVLVPSLVEAGGGSKANSTIQVKNAGVDILAVIANPPANFNLETATEQEARRAGVKFLDPGQSHKFKVKAGSSTVAAAFIDPSDANPVGEVSITTWNVEKKKTLKLRVTGGFPDEPVVVVD